jgi:phosphopantetheine--protein transferase-like protein
MALLAQILPSNLFAAEIEDFGQEIFLPAREDALVETAAPKRRRDFALGRTCAHAALKNLGHGDAVIGRGANGAPLWPQGIVGSITHTRGYAAALVGEARCFSGIGVDAERVGGVTDDLWPRLFDPEESAYLMAVEGAARSAFATLFFSAKEACYKALGGQGTLAFRDIHITPEGNGFIAARSGKDMQGRYAVEADLMVTAVWF